MLEIHPTHPQSRLISQVVKTLEQGGIAIYPTDSAYAMGCLIDNRDGIERIRRLRQLDKDHNFTLMCQDLSELSNFARVDNVIFRLLKAHTPGPYTFIMQATKDVPKRLQHPKRKTIGLRIPDHPVTLAMLSELDRPILTVSLILPHEAMPVVDLHELPSSFERDVDVIVDAGCCGIEPTTVVDFTTPTPHIIRHGKGESSVFE